MSSPSAADRTPQSGSYDVEVENLASAHQLTSDPFASGASQVVGTGTLTIAVGAKTFLGRHRLQPQHARADPRRHQPGQRQQGPRARHHRERGDGAHLVLSAQAAGAANTIAVAQSGGDGGLVGARIQPVAAHATTPSSARRRTRWCTSPASSTAAPPTPFDQRHRRRDHHAARRRTKRTKTRTLTIANDTSGTTARDQEVRRCVQRAGSSRSRRCAATSRRPRRRARCSATPCCAESRAELRTQAHQRGRAASPATTSRWRASASPPRRTARSSLDTAKLDKALAADFDGVAQLFGSENGVATRLASSLDAALRDRCAAQHAHQDAQRQERVAAEGAGGARDPHGRDREARYNAQFNALDSLLSNLSSQSAFLTQQLSSIAKIGSSDT